MQNLGGIGTLILGLCALLGVIDGRRSRRRTKVDLARMERKVDTTHEKLGTIDHAVNGVPLGSRTIREKVDAVLAGQHQHAADDARRFGQIGDQLGLKID